MLSLHTADVVITRSQEGEVGPVIRWFTKRPGDPAWGNHVGLITKGGMIPPIHLEWVGHPQITEALWKVRSGSFWTLYGPPAGPGRPKVLIYRPLTLDLETRRRIAARAEEYIGRRYGWWQLLNQGVDWWLSKKRGKEVYLFRHLDYGDRVICSQLVGRAFAPEGLRFGVPEGVIPNPDDVDDFCREHPMKYGRILGPAVLRAV